MVARSFLGCSNKSLIFLINLSPSSFGKIDLSNEKKATSQPDVSADKTRNKKIKIIFTITEI